MNFFLPKENIWTVGSILDSKSAFYAYFMRILRNIYQEIIFTRTPGLQQYGNQVVHFHLYLPYYCIDFDETKS